MPMIQLPVTADGFSIFPKDIVIWVPEFGGVPSYETVASISLDGENDGWLITLDDGTTIRETGGPGLLYRHMPTGMPWDDKEQTGSCG